MSFRRDPIRVHLPVLTLLTCFLLPFANSQSQTLKASSTPTVSLVASPLLNCQSHLRAVLDRARGAGYGHRVILWLCPAAALL
jgi:hypothetical protein